MTEAERLILSIKDLVEEGSAVVGEGMIEAAGRRKEKLEQIDKKAVRLLEIEKER